MVLLAVKDTQNQSAAGWLARLCDDARWCARCRTASSRSSASAGTAPSGTVVPCVVWFSAETQPDGWVRLRTRGAVGVTRRHASARRDWPRCCAAPP